MTSDFLALGIILMMSVTNVESSAPQWRETWDVEYTEEDASGAHVLGLWQFKPGAENRDSSSNGRDLELKGATISPDGLFGSCLESYYGWPEEDVRHAAIVPDDPGLSPDGAFSIEMWIKPKSELEGYSAFLIDKKYVSHDDYQIVLDGPDGNGFHQLRASLGFGNDSETYFSEQVILEVGVWYHIAFVYDGAGKGSFFLNGSYLGGIEHPERGSISSGRHHLSIGDRIGSYYHGFPGYIDQVRICRGALEFRPANLEFVSDRTTFIRMEEAPLIKLAVTNFQKTALSNATVRLSLDGQQEREFTLPDIAAGERYIVEYPLDTQLRHDDYRVNGQIEIPGDKLYTTEMSFPVVIVPRPLSHRMPVLMWGIYGAASVLKEMDRLKQIGFTHVLGLGADYGKIWNADEPTEPGKPDVIQERKRMLNEALANGISICATLSPGRWASSKKELLRINRNGEPNEKRPNICGLFPQFKPFCYNVGASVVKAYGRFPAFDSALLHTEVRDGAQLCFHEHDRSAFREFSGFDIPDGINTKRGVKYQELEDFPELRVIPDDHPYYIYYQWY